MCPNGLMGGMYFESVCHDPPSRGPASAGASLGGDKIILDNARLKLRQQLQLLPAV